MANKMPQTPKSLFDRWSSHPVSLAKQRKAFFWICLIPSAAVAACLVFFLSGISGWKTLLSHPTILFWIIAGTASITLGLAVGLTLLFLFACAGIARTTDDEDKLPFSRSLIVIFSFFWIVPTVLTFLQGRFGITVFPPQLVFVLNALCLAPMLALLLWVRFASRKPEEKKQRLARRPIWFLLGLFFLGLALTSLFGDVQRWLGSLHLPIKGLSEVAMRVVLLAGLLPLSMICFACWTLFRRVLPPPAKDAGGDDPAAGSRKPKGKKSLWQRFLDLFHKTPEQAEASDEAGEDTPPEWLEKLCKHLPDGVRMNTENEGVPDRLPAPDAPFSEPVTSPEADNLWLLMGVEEDKRPTELQVGFFQRFREAWEDSRLAAQEGNSMSPDMILSGDEGSGRTEVLLAAALYAAIARRQRVLYLVPDAHQADILSERLQKRCVDLFLETFLSCGILQAEQARAWVDSLKVKFSDGSENSDGPTNDAVKVVPPNVLFATPRDVERILFEGRGLYLKGSDIPPLRELLRLFEVVLVDDFMELDSMTRAHLPFLLHKLRLLLASCDIRPQFVVALPRLNENGGEAFLAARLYGSADFNKQNAVTLLPRKCESAWSVPLVVRDGAKTPAAVCEDLVRLCLGISPEMRIVLYQKGLPPHKCRELLSKLKTGSAQVRVIARLDELGEDRMADAVLYQTALAGRSGMALRLTVGGSDTVYLSVSSESEALMASEQIFPAIPDETAMALRIRHLRSLLRFVVPGQPIDLSAWERFGVSLSDRHIRKADSALGEVVLETWRQDEWSEPSYGIPLWPYVVLEKSESVKSNSGSEVDFGMLPYTDEDIVQLGDEPLLGLGRPHAILENEKTVSIGTGIGSIAQWSEKGRSLGFVDLAHAERLLLGRSEQGENVSADSDSAVSVFTVDSFEDGNDACQCQMEIRPWVGDGSDFDTPVRRLAWTIEPVSEPKNPRIAPGRTFGFFSLPSCRDIPRTVTGTITGRVSRYGQELPDPPERDYFYPAFFSGVLLAPRKMDARDMGAVIQRGVFGQWNTKQQEFSFVLTHLLSGVLRRLVPDFSFYAAMPVFHLRDSATSVAAAVAWLIQPLNSGKTVDGLVKDLVLGMEGQRKILDALREAFGLMDAQRDRKARLRWLRSFSCSAFFFDDTHRSEEEQQRDFDEDVQRSREVLESMDKRLAGEEAEIEGLADPVPSTDADDSWMLEARQFDASALGAADVWRKVLELPGSPSVRESGCLFTWTCFRKEFQMSVGFVHAGDAASYDNLVNKHFRARTCGDCYLEYGVNDPYRAFIGELYAKLRDLFEEKLPDAGPAQFAEFLLAFVQGGIAYAKDPTNAATDWPRYPSETLMLGGGDCEDTSILYAELLRFAKIENAILSIPSHAAVGVHVKMDWTSSRKEPVQYVWLGKNYVYAETANDKFVTPLGEETSLIPSSDAIKADVIPTPMNAAGSGLPIKVLNAVWEDGSLLVTVCATDSVGDSAIVVYGRPKKFVYDRPDAGQYTCVGGIRLPALKPMEVWEARVNISSGEIAAQRYWLDVFACDVATGRVSGHFVGVTRLSKA